jgi:hypothetical protein
MTTRPKNDTEKMARQEWMHGSPAAAMKVLRAAGYDERARANFLLKVVGVRESALPSDELHRDRYLDWLEEREAVAEHEHSFSKQLSLPVKIAGAVTGYSDYRECTCGERVPAEVVKPDGSLMTLAEYEASPRK